MVLSASAFGRPEICRWPVWRFWRHLLRLETVLKADRGCSQSLCSSNVLSHLQKRERLKVNMVVSWWAAGLTYITDHDGDATLVGVRIAVPSLQARQCSLAAILWESDMKWSFRCCQSILTHGWHRLMCKQVYMSSFTGAHRAALLAPYLKAFPAFDREEHYLRWHFFSEPKAAALLLICNTLPRAGRQFQSLSRPIGWNLGDTRGHWKPRCGLRGTIGHTRRHALDLLWQIGCQGLGRPQTSRATGSS